MGTHHGTGGSSGLRDGWVGEINVLLMSGLGLRYSGMAGHKMVGQASSGSGLGVSPVTGCNGITRTRAAWCEARDMLGCSGRRPLCGSAADWWRWAAS